MFYYAIKGLLKRYKFYVLTVGVIVQARIAQGLGNDLTTLTAPLQLSGTAAWQFFLLTLVISVALSLFLARKLAGMKPVDNLSKI